MGLLSNSFQDIRCRYLSNQRSRHCGKKTAESLWLRGTEDAKPVSPPWVNSSSVSWPDIPLISLVAESVCRFLRCLIPSPAFRDTRSMCKQEDVSGWNQTNMEVRASWNHKGLIVAVDLNYWFDWTEKCGRLVRHTSTCILCGCF